MQICPQLPQDANLPNLPHFIEIDYT